VGDWKRRREGMPTTRRPLGNFFELEDVGPKVLRGYPRQVQTWAVVRARFAESRHRGAGGEYRRKGTLENLVIQPQFDLGQRL
jgi:hypothetical protein